jgi:hypothetical protein
MYLYYLLNRPPFVGTHPRGDIERLVWQPTRPIPDEDGGNGQRWAHGWVTYDHALPPDDVYRYELWPARPEERNRFSLTLIHDVVRHLPREAEIFRLRLPLESLMRQVQIENRDRSIQFELPCTPELEQAIGSLREAYFMGLVGTGEIELIVWKALAWPSEW